MTFKLKNAHKLRALEHAVTLINKNHGKTLLARRLEVVEQLRSTILSIFTPSADDRHNENFIAEDLAFKTNSIALGEFSALLYGEPAINAALFPIVVEKVENNESLDKLLTLRAAKNPSQPNHDLKLSREILSFRIQTDPSDRQILHRRGADVRLPRANLFAALYLKTNDPTAQMAQNALRALLTEAIDIAAQIIDLHKDLPAMVRAIAVCTTDDDLFEIFPAARSLFEPDESHRAERDPHGAAALRSLHG